MIEVGGRQRTADGGQRTADSDAQIEFCPLLTVHSKKRRPPREALVGGAGRRRRWATISGDTSRACRARGRGGRARCRRPGRWRRRSGENSSGSRVRRVGRCSEGAWCLFRGLGHVPSVLGTKGRVQEMSLGVKGELRPEVVRG